MQVLESRKPKKCNWAMHATANLRSMVNIFKCLYPPKDLPVLNWFHTCEKGKVVQDQGHKDQGIKSRSTASAQLSAYAD